MKISKTKLRHLGCVALTLMMGGYLILTLSMADSSGAKAICQGMRVNVRHNNDTLARPFVTAAEISHDLSPLPERAAGMRLGDINLEDLRRRLESIDKIEDVEVVRTTDGMISIVVTPLVPVARVFDNTSSYYINKDGKRISANARYHCDVPVLTGRFPRNDTTFSAVSLLPLLDYISADKRWSRLITMIHVEGPNDIILIPAITGHVINFGSPQAFETKFKRLERMYTEVLPVKGWNYYDTLSVKWAGQVVATRRVKPVAEDVSVYDDEEDDANISTMLAADGVAPGQTRPGVKAHSEKPIPAARKEEPKADKPKADKPKAETAETKTQKSKSKSTTP